MPGLRPIDPSVWDVGTEHFTERFQLFVIIALGETIVITGATTSGLDLDLATITAFGLAFVITAALWWLYFNYVSVIAARRLALATNRTVLARDAYTYLHVLLVAGIIVNAVGDELVIKHPTEQLPSEELIALVAGPTLYLLAHVALRLRMTGTISTKRLAGALACVAVGLLGSAAPALVVGALLLAILIAVIVAEQISFARRTARGEPHPLERLEAEAGSG